MTWVRLFGLYGWLLIPTWGSESYGLVGEPPNDHNLVFSHFPTFVLSRLCGNYGMSGHGMTNDFTKQNVVQQ
eukprot:2622813-Amphidinium_carterae.1